MELKRLHLENFMGLSEADLSFVQGVHYISGINNDMGAGGVESNGAGKSAIFDGLKWIQYETVDREEFKADDAVNTTVGKNCLGELEFLEGDKSYIICRTRKHDELGNSLSFSIDGQDYTEHTLPETKAALAKVLPLSENIFQYAVQVGQNMPYRFLSLKETAKRELLGEIVDLSFYDGAHERSKATSRDISQQLHGLESVITSKKEQWTGYNDSLLDAQRELNNFKTKTGDDVAEVQKEMAVLDEKVLALTEAAESASKTVQELERKEQEFLHRGAEIQSMMTEYSATALRLQTDISKYARDQERYVKLGDTCPTCEQKIDKEKLLTSLTAMAEKQDALELDLELLMEPKAAVHRDYEVHCESVRELQNARSKAFQASQARVHEASGFRSRREFLASSLSEHERKEALYQGKIEQLNTLMEAVSKEVPKLEEEKEDLEEKDRHCTFWVNSIPNLKAAALEDVLAYINLRLEEYMEILSDGAMGVKLYQESSGRGSKIKVDIRTPSKKYGVSSGGEKRRIDLAIYLALSDLTQASHGVSCSLLVCDEICDGLSPNGVRKFLELLRSKADSGHCIFVISHNPALQQSFEFDSHYVVERSGDLARLRRD